MEILSYIGFEIAILLLVALIGYVISVRFGQSGLIGMILSGILIGPVLGLVHYSEAIENLAYMGAIFLLFSIGLECKFKEIYTFKNVMIALVGVIIPWYFGFVAGLFFYNIPEAIFIGTALTATSIAITANVLKEFGMIDTPAAKAIIGAAVVDDVLSLIALTATKSISFGTISVSSIIFTVVVAIAFLILASIFGNKFLSNYMNRIEKWAAFRKIPSVVFIAVMIVVFAYSTLAELIGLSAIVGAFVAGVSLERSKIQSSREGIKYLEMIFASIFFVSLGLLIDIKSISGIWLFLTILTIVAFFGKFIGCFIPAKMMGLSMKESLVVGLGMVPRGEVAMIMALYGFNNKIIGQDLYSSILLMSIITTLIAPMLIKMMFKEK